MHKRADQFLRQRGGDFAARTRTLTWRCATSRSHVPSALIGALRERSNCVSFTAGVDVALSCAIHTAHVDLNQTACRGKYWDSLAGRVLEKPPEIGHDDGT